MNVSPLPLSCKEHSALNPVSTFFFFLPFSTPFCRHLPILPDEKRTEIADDFTEIFDKEAISNSKGLLYSDAKCPPKVYRQQLNATASSHVSPISGNRGSKDYHFTFRPELFSS